MSELPPPVEISYESVPEFRNAPLLVKLAGIFTLVSAGFSLIGALYMAVTAGFMGFVLSGAAARPGGPPPPPFPIWVFVAMYSAFAVAAVGVAVVKVIAGIKLLRLRRKVWGWGLAGAIVGCIEVMWCSVGCVIPLAAGIYTIVILCLDHVRAYLQACAGRQAD